EPSSKQWYTASLHDALPISLRHAAVKIICQRAITGRPFEEILSNATSKNPKIRWQALKSLRGIYQLISFTHVPQEMQPRVFKARSEEHTSELQSRENLVCRL